MSYSPVKMISDLCFILVRCLLRSDRCFYLVFYCWVFNLSYIWHYYFLVWKIIDNSSSFLIFLFVSLTMYIYFVILVKVTLAIVSLINDTFYVISIMIFKYQEQNKIKKIYSEFLLHFPLVYIVLFYVQNYHVILAT